MFDTTVASAKSVLATAAFKVRVNALMIPVIALQAPVLLGRAAEKAQAKLLGIDN